MTRPPLRFLLAILLLWVSVRAAILLPDWSGGLNPLPTATAAPRPLASGVPPPRHVLAAAAPEPPRPSGARQGFGPEMPERTGYAPARRPAAAAPVGPAPQSAPATLPESPPPLALVPRTPARAASPRWRASAWLLIRDDDGGSALAPGGTLGGSQTGARLTYALGGGFALSGRAYLPLRRTSGAELAAGIDWRPDPSQPVNLLAERRQRLGRDGRSAFALTLYGGASREVAPRVRLDLYGQAGIVGLRSRDPFVDGAARLSRRVGPVELGAGAWGAAQPGAARLDAGPSLSWRLPVPAANLRLQADWRFRIAGGAAPRSGPALTLAADF